MEKQKIEIEVDVYLQELEKRINDMERLMNECVMYGEAGSSKHFTYGIRRNVLREAKELYEKLIQGDNQ